MSFKTTLIAIALIVCSANAHAQTDFFWSFSDLNSGATNSFANGNYAVGDTGSLFLYYARAAEDIDAVAGVDISVTSNDVIHFTAAETMDFDIVLTQVPDVTIGGRWETPDGTGGYSGGGISGPAEVVSDNEIVGLQAFTVSNAGMVDGNTGGANAFFDEGFDINADAFLFGRVDFVAVGNGSTSLETITSAIGIVGNGQAIEPVYGSATITVGVPEPSSVSLLVLGIVAVLNRRRR